MDTYALLERAILHREQVLATYEGEEREFCPHALGTKGQRRHVLAYQFGGSSRSALPSRGEWRCFEVDLLENASTRTGPWHTAPNVFNPQTCLDEIDIVVQPAPPRAATTAREE
jgi:predicted DNA-binding transcriptional regulator YafY